MSRYLLKGGLVMDGTGARALFADVLVEDDRIARVAPEIQAEAAVIDCTGLCISPGWIDAHSHNDWFVHRGTRYFEPFLCQGMTTQVVGNCGFSPFGFAEDTCYLTDMGGGLFAHSGERRDGVFTQWAAQHADVPLNLVPLVGHGTARIGVHGKGNGALSGEQMHEMLSALEGALEQGVFGVSLGLMYEPGQFAPWDELLAVAKLVAKHKAMLTIHARAYSTASTSYGFPIGGRAHNLRALQETIDLCQQSGAKTQCSHLIFVGKGTWKTEAEALRMLDASRSQGLAMGFDLYSSTFGASVITVILPPWYLALNAVQRQTKLVRARLAVEVGVTKKILGFGFKDILIAYIGKEYPQYEGKNVAEIAEMEHTSELDTYLKLVTLSRGQGRVLMGKYYHPDMIFRLAQHPAALLMTDAWVEDSGVQNAAAYGAFPRFLQLAREGGLGIESFVRKMTGAIADRFEIKDRGYVRQGAAADITVFDPRTVAGNAERPEHATGVIHVLINGQTALHGGEVTAGFGTGGRILQKC